MEIELEFVGFNGGGHDLKIRDLMRRKSAVCKSSLPEKSLGVISRISLLITGS